MLEDGHQAIGDGVIGDTDADVKREESVREEIEKGVDLGFEQFPNSKAR